MKKLFALLILIIMFSACGEPTIDIRENNNFIIHKIAQKPDSLSIYWVKQQYSITNMTFYARVFAKTGTWNIGDTIKLK